MLLDMRRLLLLAGVIAGYALLTGASPVRPSLRDGLRCLRRYPQAWGLPLAFNLGHALFVLWTRLHDAMSIPGAPPAIAPWQGWQQPPMQETLAAIWLPALESTASVFNCIVTAFPLSAPVALLFLCNWRGYHAGLRRALRRRFGFLGALAIELVLVACAACAVVKPLLFGGLQWLNRFLSEDALLRAGEAVNWLGFVFEYVLGVALQIYLILLCFAWVRGLSFDFEELRRFALRRLSFVLKWAGVVLVLSSAGINLPLLLASFRPPADAGAEPAAVHVVVLARWALAAILLVFCSMQITLVFHNESLRRAFADHWRLVRLHRWRIGWLVWIAVLHFTLVAGLDATLLHGLGERTWPGTLWESFLFPAIWSVLAAWLLASWVCLFRRCVTGRPDAEELVRF